MSRIHEPSEVRATWCRTLLCWSHTGERDAGEILLRIFGGLRGPFRIGNNSLGQLRRIGLVDNSAADLDLPGNILLFELREQDLASV